MNYPGKNTWSELPFPSPGDLPNPRIEPRSPTLHLRDEAESTQIDLLIERDDRVINACEIKFYSDEFVVDKTYYRKLLSRQGMLVERISPKVSVHQTLISTYGLKRNEYSGVFTQVITLDDLLLE